MKSLRVLTLCFIFGWTSTQGNGLIAHFTFDNDTPAALKSTDGKYVFESRKSAEQDLSTVEFVEGVHGKALHLKKGNVIHYCLPPGVLTDFQAPFTIALWIKKTETEPNHGVFCGTCSDPSDFGFEFAWFWRKAILRWGKREENMIITQGETLTENIWHHLAVTHDGKIVTIYIDAIPFAVRSVQTPFVDVPESRKAANQFTLGQYPTNFDAYPHVGMLDDLFLFSRALSREEIVSVATRSE